MRVDGNLEIYMLVVLSLLLWKLVVLVDFLSKNQTQPSRISKDVREKDRLRDGFFVFPFVFRFVGKSFEATSDALKIQNGGLFMRS